MNSNPAPPTATSPSDHYARTIKRRLMLGGFFGGLLLGLSWWSLNTGSYELAWTVLLGFNGDPAIDPELVSHIFYNIRLPRLVASLFAGASLALAGSVMQNVLRNPLASPFTLGVSQGAAFGASFAIIILGAGTTSINSQEAVWVHSPSLVMLMAFGGAMATVAALVLLSTIRRLDANALILAGVAISALFSALTMLLQYFGSDFQVAATVFWTFGDVGKATWVDTAWIGGIFVLIGVTFFHCRWKYNFMLWGEETAGSMGVRPHSFRLLSLTGAALLATVTISFLGIIGFIGLMAPHIARLIVGDDYRFLLPYSALAGACLLVTADTFARIVMAPVVLPVGILTAFAGAPLFLYLLIRRKGAI